MATIVNNPGPERVVEVDRTDGTSGWAVAVIVLIAVIVGLLGWFYYHRTYAPAAPASNGSANINVTLPAQDNGTSGVGTGDTGAGN